MKKIERTGNSVSPFPHRNPSSWKPILGKKDSICRSQRVDCVVVELTLSDMSGLEVLVNLAPIAKSPEMAVVILTRTVFASISTVALSNGAQAYLVKSRSSGDDLDKAIQKAIAVVGPEKHRQR